MAEEKNNKQENSSDLLTEKMLETRTVIISGEINDEVARDVANKLLLLEATSNDPINLFISTQGGHVDSGFYIRDMINFIKPKVNIIGSGWVVSAGIFIYLSGDKERRYSLPNTRFMMHQPSGGAQGQSTEIEITAKEIVRTRRRINEVIAQETGQDLEKVEEDTNRDYWLSVEEALDYGIVNKIISSRDEIE
ncbi:MULTISPECIES: ATP-dependent Clp protease proteolytic subunit [Staphylococcus]|jgi:ATP-dependent Clp protease protease subunit|uniref:ATP-dependent Clp protease proteolytic subunit n=2 Tax=Staphylococcus TaxID=1279 RepID=A0A7X3JWZ1_STAAU|nr:MULTISPECIES: ATP-dependent Clp protease proteolytic subunit [Staphylococcus]MDN6187135.1 ATP-dependent Clp protease proteolytic subunit [Tetragenococcus halophilus]MDK9850643.1 ATP-dependent Clp protease proteolytic subunit [Staphylococcus equorum]MDK9861504.1 ATP-dependent Clp protease proteolytic subunit [Staphylococcus equorum]MDN6742541.1 ATP-dependent Clp protease proteolytic subunit [Staphylococcus equorum]MVK36136.1 ATP-dependent Clp protease proteolytic subunit [Staphylococcus aure